MSSLSLQRELLTPRESYRYWRVARSTVTVGTSSTLLVRENPDRVLVIFSPATAGSFRYDWGALTGAGSGHVNPANGEPVILIHRDHGVMTQMPIFAIAGIPVDVNVTEFIIDRFPTDRKRV